MSEWKEQLPEQIREAPYFKNAESPEQVLADLQNAAAWQGNSMRLPGPDAGQEDLQQFHERLMEKVPGLMPTPDPANPETLTHVMAKLGVPEAADGYRLPEGVDIAGDALGQLKSQAHKVGLTQAQFEAQLALMTETGASQDAARRDALAEQERIIKEEWGPAYTERMGEIQAMLNKDGTPADIKDAFANGALDAQSLRWLHSVAIAGTEAPQAQAQADGSSRTLDKSETLAQIAELERLIFAPSASSDPGYQGWCQKRLQLMATLDPNSARQIDEWARSA